MNLSESIISIFFRSSKTGKRLVSSILCFGLFLFLDMHRDCRTDEKLFISIKGDFKHSEYNELCIVFFKT